MDKELALQNESTILSARISSLVIELTDKRDPTIFAENDGENFCVRLQCEISREVTKFFRELSIPQG